MDPMTVLSLKKPTHLSRTEALVPVPKGAIPPNGLPIWKVIPVYQKLPTPDLPEGLITYTRARLGYPLWEQPRGAPFDNRAGKPIEYDGQHDPHLRPHFRRLRASGQSGAPSLHPICSLREFNEQRARLAILFAMELRKCMQALDAIEKDKMILKRVEIEKEKRLKRFLNDEKSKEHFRRLAEEHLEETLAIEREIKQRADDMENRIKRVAENKIKLKEENAKRALEKSELVRQRVEASKEIAMLRRVNNLKNIRLEKIRIAKYMKHLDDERKRKKRESDTRRWKKRCEEEVETMERNERLLRAHEVYMAAMVLRSERHRARRVQVLSPRARAVAIVAAQPWAAASLDVKEQVIGDAILKLWKTMKNPDAKREDKSKEVMRGPVQDVVESTLKDRRDMLSALQLGIARMNYLQSTPKPVMGIINYLLTFTVKTCSIKEVEKMMNTISALVLGKINTTVSNKMKIAKETKKLTIGLTHIQDTDHSVTFGGDTVDKKQAKKNARRETPSFSEMALASSTGGGVRWDDHELAAEAGAEELHRSMCRARSLVAEHVYRRVYARLDFKTMRVRKLAKKVEPVQKPEAVEAVNELVLTTPWNRLVLKGSLQDAAGVIIEEVLQKFQDSQKPVPEPGVQGILRTEVQSTALNIGKQKKSNKIIQEGS